MIFQYEPGVIDETFEVGSVFSSLDLCKEALARAFYDRMLAEEFVVDYKKKKTPTTGKAKAVLTCPLNRGVKVADRRCPFKVYVLQDHLDSNTGQLLWRVAEIAHHSCRGEGTRKREHSLVVKTANSSAVANFVPSPMNANHFRHGDPKRLRIEHARSGGVPLTAAQSFKIVRKLTQPYEESS